jgi:peptidoglycan/xylan/chitin deacetylase (PgdA/CDA1 family)
MAPGALETLLAEALRRGVSFQAIAKLFQEPTGKGDVFVTIDDGFADVFENAFPIFEKLQIPFAFFITPPLVGTKDYCSWSQLRKMLKSPLCTIGSHAMTHADMTCQPDIAHELGESKRILEKELNAEIFAVAYPYGRANRAMSSEAAKHYRLGFITKDRPVRSLNNTFAIPRKTVGPWPMLKYALQFS